MAEGTIKRITDKGFGFIDDGTDQNLFFHSSAVQEVRILRR
jgi:CspA family cold shock protein